MPRHPEPKVINGPSYEWLDRGYWVPLMPAMTDWCRANGVQIRTAPPSRNIFQRFADDQHSVNAIRRQSGRDMRHYLRKKVT